jgi:hypothetical protein
MDATTFANVRLNEHRAADQARELRLLAAQAERRAEFGAAAVSPSQRSIRSLLSIRPRPATGELAPYALAGPSA